MTTDCPTVTPEGNAFGAVDAVATVPFRVSDVTATEAPAALELTVPPLAVNSWEKWVRFNGNEILTSLFPWRLKPTFSEHETL
jgi:DNA-directed RNA polymerase beta subunit